MSIQTRVIGIVQGMLERRYSTTELGPTQDLRSAGLTSLNMVQLILTVEEEFNIEIPQSEMIPENFRTVRAIDALVSALTGKI